MSFDLAVWKTPKRLTDGQANALYNALCESRVEGVEPSPGVEAFYAELTSKHPALDAMPDDRVDDQDLCPWSCSFDRSPGHVILSCVWPKADYVQRLVEELAGKHGLAVFDPQAGRVFYPGTGPRAGVAARKPWWRFW